MRRPRIFRWRNLETTSGLLLIAQRIEEALFDYTLDTYKTPSLNTHTRCAELLRVIDDVRSRVLLEKNVTPVVEELAWSISNDVATHSLLGPLTAKYADFKYWAINDLDRLRTQTELLRAHLRNRQYEKQLTLEIESRLTEAKRKRELLALCTDLIVEWLNRGFSRDFIYHKTRTFFFSPSGPDIESNDQWRAFLGEFGQPARKFTVVLRVKRTALLQVFPTAGTIQDVLHPRTELPKERRFLERDEDETFLTFKAIEQLDARSAAKRARGHLDSAQRFVIYHSHREKFEVHPDTLVYDGDKAVVLKPSASAVHKELDCSEMRFPNALKQMAMAMFGRLLDKESTPRLTAALALHASAVSSADLTVQLTSLWAAIEALLPMFDDQAKISVIADNLCPALSRYYPLRLITQLESDLMQCIPAEYEEVRGRLRMNLPRCLHCAAIVSIPSNEPLRDQLYGALNASPLLKFRLFQVMTATESGEALLKLLKEHATRVNWHIRRIYRSRNLLVHAGRRLPYLDGLVENIHSYFHRLMDGLVDICSRANAPSDLDAAFLAMRIETESHTEFLEKNTESIAEQSLVESLCGPIMGAECRKSGVVGSTPVEEVVSRWGFLPET